MQNESNHESKDIQNKPKSKSLIGKKVGLGVVMLLILLIFGNVLESVENRSFMFVLSLVFLLCIALLNNALCTKWLSLDKLQKYKYSWRAFGIICLVFWRPRVSNPDGPTSFSLLLSESMAAYLFLGYLLFYLGDRYVKRRVLNVALKSFPFVVLMVFCLINLSPVLNVFQSAKPKSVRYLDVHSGQVFEISGKDGEKAIPTIMGFAAAAENISSYEDLINRCMSRTLDRKSFSKQTSKIDEEWKSQIKAVDSLVQLIESRVYRNLLLTEIGFFKERFFALMTIKEGIEATDSSMVQIGMELLNKNASRLPQILRDFSSFVRVEPGDQIEEQRCAGLLTVEIIEIQNEVDQYELTFQDLCNEVLTLRDFRQKMNHHETVAADHFRRCDSLMARIRRPEALGLLQKYVNFPNIRSSIPHQKFQALSSLVKAYIDYDSAAYSVNYTKYIDLCRKSDELVNDLFSSYLK
jgi:hypothetical protein